MEVEQHPKVTADLWTVTPEKIAAVVASLAEFAPSTSW
jgi:hypothetical protein